MIYLTVGIPASGKSTWAKQYVCDNYEDTIRVCRDDLRLMLGGTQMLDSKGEKLVTKLVEHTIANKGKKNLVVDQTNCNPKYLDKLIDFAFSFDTVKLVPFNIDLDLAIERDSARVKGRVGREVIERMYKGFCDVCAEWDFEELIYKREYKALLNNERVIADNLPKAVIFDIDGTIAHNENRRSPFEWNKVGMDSVDPIVRNALFNYQQCGYKIVLLSGRDSICREETEEWLQKYYITYDDLFMRAVNDNRSDSIIKEELYKGFVATKYKVEVIFDDRNKVVSHWRSMGLKCFQVAEGDF